MVMNKHMTRPEVRADRMTEADGRAMAFRPPGCHHPQNIAFIFLTLICLYEEYDDSTTASHLP